MQLKACFPDFGVQKIFLSHASSDPKATQVLLGSPDIWAVCWLKVIQQFRGQTLLLSHGLKTEMSSSWSISGGRVGLPVQGLEMRKAASWRRYLHADIPDEIGAWKG